MSYKNTFYNMRVAFFFPVVIRMARVEKVTDVRTACGTVLWSNSFFGTDAMYKSTFESSKICTALPVQLLARLIPVIFDVP